MKLDVLSDATGTVLTGAHPFACSAGTIFWWDQDATQGYASRSSKPRIAAFRHTDASSRYFAVHNERGGCAWAIHDPEPDFDDMGLFWSVPATADEIGLGLPLLADLISLRRQQPTSYLFVFDDAVESWRNVVEDLRTRSLTSTAEPVVIEQSTESAWVEQLTELKQIAALTNEQLSSLFDVSRTSVQEWLTGRGMRTGNREHLRQILTILRDAYQRLGSSHQLHEILMMPIGKRHLRPFDHLVEKQYAIARGYLQQRPSLDRNRERRPIRSRVKPSEMDRLDRLEDLNPPPRAVRDDE
jgi:hypothetical protein